MTTSTIPTATRSVSPYVLTSQETRRYSPCSGSGTPSSEVSLQVTWRWQQKMRERSSTSSMLWASRVKERYKRR
jgi:hypothetical protein